jgi:hypothetical protein
VRAIPIAGPSPATASSAVRRANGPPVGKRRTVETGRRFSWAEQTKTAARRRQARSLRTQQRARPDPPSPASFLLCLRRDRGPVKDLLPKEPAVLDDGSSDARPNSQCSTHELDARHSLAPMLLRKEVIQPHLPVRLPCYDFVPIADPTFDSSLPCGLGHWLRVLPTFVT